ncbi:hypothetical protein CARN8_330008 [mine drainage metagenome]|uniref:Uncharacterized protein n=1 Tax=mine drainage metagenome TaxID=410659 RepID=A0A3P3ZNY7_9ZZZZ
MLHAENEHPTGFVDSERHFPGIMALKP